MDKISVNNKILTENLLKEKMGIDEISHEFPFKC